MVFFGSIVRAISARHEFKSCTKRSLAFKWRTVDEWILYPLNLESCTNWLLRISELYLRKQAKKIEEKDRGSTRQFNFHSTIHGTEQFQNENVNWTNRILY